jgi:hypothetical protein
MADGYRQRDFVAQVAVSGGPEPVWIRIHSMAERHVVIASKMPGVRHAATVSARAADIAQHVQDQILHGQEMLFLEHYHRDISPDAGREQVNVVTFRVSNGRLETYNRTRITPEQATELAKAALRGVQGPGMSDLDAATGSAARPAAPATPPPPKAAAHVPAYFGNGPAVPQGVPDVEGLDGPVEEMTQSDLEEEWLSVVTEMPAAALGE